MVVPVAVPLLVALLQLAEIKEKLLCDVSITLYVPALTPTDAVLPWLSVVWLELATVKFQPTPALWSPVVSKEPSWSIIFVTVTVVPHKSPAMPSSTVGKSLKSAAL